jgi:hypothetical protein
MPKIKLVQQPLRTEISSFTSVTPQPRDPNSECVAPTHRPSKGPRGGRDHVGEQTRRMSVGTHDDPSKVLRGGRDHVGEQMRRMSVGTTTMQHDVRQTRRQNGVM